MAKLTGAARNSAVLRIATELAKVLLEKTLEEGYAAESLAVEMAMESAAELANKIVDEVYK